MLLFCAFYSKCAAFCPPFFRLRLSGPPAGLAHGPPRHAGAKIKADAYDADDDVFDDAAQRKAARRGTGAAPVPAAAAAAAGPAKTAGAGGAAPGGSFDSSDVRALTEMGFPRAAACSALCRGGYDLERALAFLTDGGGDGGDGCDDGRAGGGNTSKEKVGRRGAFAVGSPLCSPKAMRSARGGWGGSIA